MYQIGDYVIKTNKGVCRIADISVSELSGNDPDKLYYILVPVLNDKVKIFVPTEPEPQSLRPIMTREEAHALIQSMPEVEQIKITNEKFARDQYRACLNDKDPRKLASILKTIYLRNKERNAQGKKTTSLDERYYKTAEEYFNTELSMALGVDKKEIIRMIDEVMGSL